MTHFVTRTCTEIPESDSQYRSDNTSLPLENYREANAFVLLGAPGAGKTKAFEREAECTGGLYVTARDFVTFGDMPEWCSTVLYIDGLDETRAGATDGRTPLDYIRAKLVRLGRPRFRLSCREADWFGANDRDHLKTISPGGKVTVLRLDPLSDKDIREILLSSGIEDADRFVASAREMGIDGLLANPQSLRMLATAVADDGVWPGTRMQTFDKACRALLVDHNQEHRIAEPDYVDIPVLMDAAGRLCAIQLLTGGAGYTLLGHEGDRDFPELERIPCESSRILRRVLDTKLFEAPSEERVTGRVTPVHRQIAEFLAARYLANLIDNGLPTRRALALMTGHDGGVVTELRGLSAWLAAHSKTSRIEIVERDPFGTILYGDVREFSADEKRRVLDCLVRETKKNPWFMTMFQFDSRLGDLATPDMEDIFRESLTGPTRDSAWQSFVLILIESLKHGQALPGLADLMMEIVRNVEWRSDVRRTALDALFRQRGDGESTTADLKVLLTDVRAGSVPDPNDDLLGSLLRELYPGRLSASKLWEYLKTPQNPSFYGWYCDFWNWHVPKKSTAAQLAELLDGLVEQFEQLRPVFIGSPGRSSFFRVVPIRLLRHFLEISSGNISLDRFFDWLGVASDPELRSSVEDLKFLRDWLSRNPDMQKNILETGVAHCADSPDFVCCMVNIEDRLFNSDLPADFGSWCLEQAITASDRTDLKAARYFILQVADFVSHHRFDEGLSREIVERRIKGHPGLLSMFTERLTDREEVHTRGKDFQEQDENKRRQRRRDWRNHVESREAALIGGRCEPTLLHQLAEVYFGQFIDVEGDTPLDRLRYLFGDDERLSEVVLEGLRGSVGRSDVPDDAEIIRLGAENQIHHLALPFLAGLEEIAKVAPEDGLPLNEKQMRQAFAFLYAEPPGLASRWYERASKSNPEVAVDVLVRTVRAGMRSGNSRFTGVYRLEDSEEIARLAAFPLLESFPVRCTTSQLEELVYLLKTALLHCGEAPVLELLHGKLAHRSMNVAQRICWLAIGFLVSPVSYCERLEAYVAGGDERHVRHLAYIMCRNDLPAALIGRLGVAELELLIRLLGPAYKPSPVGSKGERIRKFINKLASVPSQAAKEAFETLLSDGGLRPWRSYLVDAAYRQNAVRREAGFQHCTIGQVLETLDNRKPVNAPDLSALTFEFFREIAQTIRHGNTSDWRQYWNVDSHNRPQEPKPENACRDALLSDLKLKMDPLGVDVQPEGHYADDKRSDIRVFCAGFNVPVEIKKSCHRDLWSAIKTQLIAKYTRDPGTDGYGIYLVFWFGDTESCRLTPGAGSPPKSAAEIEKRLRKTLSADERLKISICVIDVSEPAI